MGEATLMAGFTGVSAKPASLAGDLAGDPDR